MASEIKIIDALKLGRVIVVSAIGIVAAVAGGTWKVAETNTHVVEALQHIDERDNTQQHAIDQITQQQSRVDAKVGVLEDRTTRNERAIDSIRADLQGGGRGR